MSENGCDPRASFPTASSLAIHLDGLFYYERFWGFELIHERAPDRPLDARYYANGCFLAELAY